jgi:hypothetical protein
MKHEVHYVHLLLGGSLCFNAQAAERLKLKEKGRPHCEHNNFDFVMVAPTLSPFDKILYSFFPAAYPYVGNTVVIIW